MSWAVRLVFLLLFEPQQISATECACHSQGMMDRLTRYCEKHAQDLTEGVSSSFELGSRPLVRFDRGPDSHTLKWRCYHPGALDYAKSGACVDDCGKLVFDAPWCRGKFDKTSPKAALTRTYHLELRQLIKSPICGVHAAQHLDQSENTGGPKVQPWQFTILMIGLGTFGCCLVFGTSFFVWTRLQEKRDRPLYLEADFAKMDGADLPNLELL